VEQLGNNHFRWSSPSGEWVYVSASPSDRRAQRRSLEEYQAQVNEIGRYLDRVQMEEQDQLARETDANESRRLWDWDFRRSYDRRHPGCERGECDCPGHRAWRREPPR
jgi:hypothetical protein